MTNSSKYYTVEGNKLVRNHRSCPKCGPSYFLADHYDRNTCGNCGYTVFKRKGAPAAAKRTTRRTGARKRTKSQ